MSLADEKCVPCRGGVPPMAKDRAEMLLRELAGGWHLAASGHIERTYTFDDFAQAMAFADRLADIAEGEGHHPDLHIAWGRCTVELWTHKINGLTESDFFFAAKADRAYSSTSDK